MDAYTDMDCGERRRFAYLRFLEAFVKYIEEENAATEKDLEIKMYGAGDTILSIPYFEFNIRERESFFERLKEKASSLRKNDFDELKKFLAVVEENARMSKILAIFFGKFAL